MAQLKKWIAAAILLLAVVWFLHRSVIVQHERNWTDRLWDFGIIYTSSHQWLIGRDPYDAVDMIRWSDQHFSVPADFRRNLLFLKSVTPPSTFVCFLPFAVLSPDAAGYLWVTVTFSLVAIQIVAMIRLAGLKWSDPRGALLAAVTLCMSPLHLSLQAGQPTAIAVPLIVIGIYLASVRRDLAAGILLGIAAGFKGQLALPFIVMYFWLRRWRLGTFSLAILAGITMIGFGRLQLTHTLWSVHWHENLWEEFRPGGLNDYAWPNSYRSGLLNLQVLLTGFMSNRTLIEVFTWLISGTLATLFAALTWRGTGEIDALYCAAIIAPLCLLPLYHRYYDATILTLTLTFAFRSIRQVRVSLPAAIIVLVLVTFYFPEHVVDKYYGRAAAFIRQVHVFNMLVLPHRTWVLLFIVTALLYMLARHRCDSDDSSGMARHPGDRT